MNSQGLACFGALCPALASIEAVCHRFDGAFC